MSSSNTRIFGLAAVALAACLALGYGLSFAEVSGTVRGLKITLVGPIAAFPALLAIFKVLGLFGIGLRNLPELDQPPGQMTKKKIESELRDLDWTIGRAQLKKQMHEQALAKLEEDASYAEIAAAGGMRLATRRRE